VGEITRRARADDSGMLMEWCRWTMPRLSKNQSTISHDSGQWEGRTKAG